MCSDTTDEITSAFLAFEFNTLTGGVDKVDPRPKVLAAGGPAVLGDKDLGHGEAGIRNEYFPN